MTTVFTTAAIAAAALLAAAPAAAIVTTFASFTATTANNVVFKNSGTNGSASSYASNGTGGRLFTTLSPPSVRADLAQPSAVLTSFSFLQPAIAPYITNVAANFTLSATAINAPVVQAAGNDYQPYLDGSFSFISRTPIVVDGRTFAAGSNLLSGSFTGLDLFGRTLATEAGASDAALSTGIVFTSDFMTFDPGLDEMSFNLTGLQSLVSSVNRGINFVSGNALRSFRGTITGEFASDPAPAISALPEPATWSLMLAGLGLSGLQARRRRDHCALA